MSQLFAFFANNGRVPVDLVFLILLLPIIATIVAFTRQVIGIRMFGAYAPIIATYAFLGTGLIPGAIISLIIFLSVLVIRYATRQLRLHYLPRMAMLITLVSMITLILLPLSTYTSFIDLGTISSTSVVLFILLSDIYLTAETQKGYKEAGRLYIETIVLAALMFLLASWQPFQQLLISHPEIVIVCLIIDLLIGRWKGLRLTEVYRFRSIIKEKAKDYA